MSADLESGSQSRYEQDRTWLTANLGGPILKDRLFFYGSYYRPTKTADNRANLYGELPDYDSTRNEGFGKLTFTPTQDDAAQLQLPRLEARRHERPVRRERRRHHRHRQRGAPQDRHRRRLVGRSTRGASPPSSTRTSRTDTQGRPDNIADVDISTAVGTRLDIASLDTQGRLTVPVPVSGPAPPTTRSSSRSSTATATTQNGVQDRRRHCRLRHAVRQRRLLPRRGPGRLQPHARHERDATSSTSATSGTRTGGPDAQLERLGRRSPCPAAARSFQGTADLLHRPRSSSRRHGPRADDPLRVPVAELRAQRHDQAGRTGPSTSACSLSNDTLYGQGLREDASTLSGYVAGAGQQVQDVRGPVRAR